MVCKEFDSGWEASVQQPSAQVQSQHPEHPKDQSRRWLLKHEDEKPVLKKKKNSVIVSKD